MVKNLKYTHEELLMWIKHPVCEISAYLDPITSKCENEARSVGDF